MTNCEKLARSLPEGVDCVLIESETGRRYFTGFPASDGLLFITRDYIIFGTDGRYIEAAKEKITDCNVVEIKNYSGFVRQIIGELGVKDIAVEGVTPISRVDALRRLVPDVKFHLNPAVERTVSGMRMVKNESEISKIRQAQKLTDDAFSHILNFIRAGVTERDIALELEFYMKKHGAEKESFDTIAITGKRTSMPHGVPGDNAVERGDFVTMDFGAIVDGYHSDMTRTVAVGCVSEKQNAVYEIVLSAQKSGLSALKEGVLCSEIDKISRDIIINAGYGEYFTHTTGHGVGLEIHEAPIVAGSNNQPLKCGNVVTVEPGIYIPGEFGVRIEDFAVITPDGCEDFTRSPKELIIL